MFSIFKVNCCSLDGLPQGPRWSADARIMPASSARGKCRKCEIIGIRKACVLVWCWRDARLKEPSAETRWQVNGFWAPFNPTFQPVGKS